MMFPRHPVPIILKAQVRAPIESPRLHTVLSENDIVLYRQAFLLQQTSRLQDADGVVARVRNPLLKGVLLGERYLSAGNAPSFSELALWLARYGDHAQAAELYHVARTRTPDDADFLTEPSVTETLKAFTGENDGSALMEEKEWTSGLAAFRKHDMHAATMHFKALLADGRDAFSSEDRAAAAFWTYRAALAEGNSAEAGQYLEIAAGEQPGFYSILARQISGTMRGAASEAVDNIDSASFLTRKPVIRAMALKAIGQEALAEKELQMLFPGGGEADRQHLVQLAHMLDLPAAPMRMAVAGNFDTKGDDALYPLPHWKPTQGYRIEPALLFAIMRQESGFNPDARSASGATGVMQLMPATAHAMALDAGTVMNASPAVSMTLGQHYLERLVDISAINDNLIYVIGAYNAGPGTMENWQKTLRAGEDPLLFVESIPRAQTRDYVVHVMGNYWVYADMLGGYANSSVAALAQNRWPLYDRSDKQVVSMLSHLDHGAEQ